MSKNYKFNNSEYYNVLMFLYLNCRTTQQDSCGSGGDDLKNHIGKNNSYAIIYGIQHVQNGGMMKEMKTPAGIQGDSRYSVDPTSWQGLWKAFKSWFN